MTTTIAGGRIAARIAGTFQAAAALNIGDPVYVSGDYIVNKCDATTTHIPIGTVAVPNVVRGTGALAGTYPQSQVPGDVTVELRGDSIQTVTAGATIAAGQLINVGASGTYVVGANGDPLHIGIALTSAASGAAFDLLVF